MNRPFDTKCMQLDDLLGVGRSFDMVSRELYIGGRRAKMWVVNGYAKDLLLERAVEKLQAVKSLDDVSNVDELLRQSVQALVFVCGYGWDLEKLDIPMVYIDRHPVCEQSDIIVVESDNVRGGYLAARELLRSGCRRIAFLTDSLKTSTKRSRYKGYVRALHQAGLEASDSLVISVGHQEEQQVRERIRQVLAQDPLIDGILCATDRLAIGAILGTQDCGRRIPEDLCVTGFDDGRIASVFRPGITSVRQDGIAMAKKASSILFTLLEGGQLDKRRYIIPVSLSVRESTCR